MHSLEIGPLCVTLHKTIKVRDNNETSNLPPSLGNFEIFKVSDYKCPKSWDKDAYFIAMHSKEAMWLSFQTVEPVAIVVGAGSVNALDGKCLETKLEKDGYLVTPPQPWLDGWKSNNEVYQFVATEVGENKTIGEQLSETKDHALVISVFEAKNPKELKAPVRPHVTWGGSEAGELDYCSGGICSACCSIPQNASGCDSLCNEMGLGKGGKIKQKIYEDPHGLEAWKKNPTKTVKVYLINASEFCEITGQQIPLPASVENYSGTWYGMGDKAMAGIAGTAIFNDLKSAG